MSRVLVAGTDKFGSCHDYLVWCNHEVHCEFDTPIDIGWVIEFAEAVVMTPMWEASRSAVCLKMVAETCGKQVLYYWPDEPQGDRLKEHAPSTGGEVRIVNNTTGGEKGRKPQRFELLPPSGIMLTAEVFGRGAEKYEDRNWERGVDWSLMFGAMMRHMWAWWGGETCDPETGLNHLGHAAFHVLGLIQLSETHPELDDRP